MKTMHRTRIRFEKHELTMVRLSRNARFFCSNCQTETAHLTIAQTAIAFAISEKDVLRLADSRQIHSIETMEGKFLICVGSFPNLAKIKNKTDR